MNETPTYIFKHDDFFKCEYEKSVTLSPDYWISFYQRDVNDLFDNLSEAKTLYQFWDSQRLIVDQLMRLKKFYNISGNPKYLKQFKKDQPTVERIKKLKFEDCNPYHGWTITTI